MEGGPLVIIGGIGRKSVECGWAPDGQLVQVCFLGIIEQGAVLSENRLKARLHFRLAFRGEFWPAGRLRKRLCCVRRFFGQKIGGGKGSCSGNKKGTAGEIPARKNTNNLSDHCVPPTRKGL